MLGTDSPDLPRSHLRFLLWLVCHQCLPLRRHTLLSPLACSLGLRTLGIHLFFEDTLTLLLSLGLVDLESNLSAWIHRGSRTRYAMLQ
jgi:hypothetical protein